MLNKQDKMVLSSRVRNFETELLYEIKHTPVIFQVFVLSYLVKGIVAAVLVKNVLCRLKR